MPDLTFVLPHWMYWAGLVLFPLVAMYIIRRQAGIPERHGVSLPLAYFLLVTGGFVGLHRFYLRSALGFVFIPLFVAVLLINVESREARNEVSKWRNERVSAEFLIERAQKKLEKGDESARGDLEEAQALLDSAHAGTAQAESSFTVLETGVRVIAFVILGLLILDVFLCPGIYRRCLALESADGTDGVVHAAPFEPDDSRKVVPASVRSRFTDAVDRINEASGNFVAYWSAIAVFVYYYEVLARYVFNSPTNWAHESMFLMFGMQYLLAGGYALRENAHVRVDVIYAYFSVRQKALVDVLTSVFFFIFVVTLLWSGWTFFMDSYSVREVSFTEWGIQYWPVKFAIPLGAALLLLQGLSRLFKDVLVLVNGGVPDGS